MSDIIQNDCQGEHLPDDAIPIEIELGSGGLYYGTSPEMKGLLVTGNSIKELMEKVPNAIAEMRAVAAAAAEISALKEKLNEATQIMDRINREMFEHAHRLPCMKALRVFLGVNDDV
jgi:predicted RNase H-like HicB family nuclease